MASIRLGDLLVKAKVITDAQLQAALGEQQKWGGKLGEILVRMKAISEEMLVKAVSKQLNIPAVNLDALPQVPAAVAAKIPVDIARDLQVLPLQLQDGGRTLVVAMVEPQNPRHVDAVRNASKCKIVAQIAGRQAIAKAFSRVYTGEALEQEEEFKVVDAAGHTIMKSIDSIKPPETTPTPAPVSSAPSGIRSSPSGVRAPFASSSSSPGTPAPFASSPSGQRPGSVPDLGLGVGKGGSMDVLRGIEEAQRKEVATLKALVDMLIAKGVFTRDEYLAKVKR